MSGLTPPKAGTSAPDITQVGTNGGHHGRCQQGMACTGQGCRAETGKTRRKRGQR